MLTVSCEAKKFMLDFFEEAFYDGREGFLAKFPFSARSRVVSKAWKSEDISGKCVASSWAKKRGALNDFDRFKLMKAKSARNKILNKAVNVQKRKLSKAGKL